MRGIYQLTLVGTVFLTACGGSTPPPEEPESDVAELESNDDVEQTAAGEKASNPERAQDEEGSEPGSAASSAEPEFKEGMSVNEAISAVPAGAARLNIEQEALAQPLMDSKVYEPCKLGAGHFRLKVAVWDGRAVGMDITTTPKSDTMAQCIRSQVGQIKWPDKVKSLNTVEYQL